MNWLIGVITICQLISAFGMIVIAGNLSFILDWLKKFQLTNQELCDRIWELRDDVETTDGNDPKIHDHS